MILHISCEKVGHRQAPIQIQPPPVYRRGLRRLHHPTDNSGKWAKSDATRVIESVAAGLPALQDGESGQVRKEAATAIYCKCRGLGSPLSFLIRCGAHELSGSRAQVAAAKFQ